MFEDVPEPSVVDLFGLALWMFLTSWVSELQSHTESQVLGTTTWRGSCCYQSWPPS